MKRFFLALGIAMLLLETSGVSEMLRPEPCPLNESASQHESCAAACVRCACCAQPILGATNAAVSSGINPLSSSPLPVEPVAEDPQVRDITHVPKSLLS